MDKLKKTRKSSTAARYQGLASDSDEAAAYDLFPINNHKWLKIYALVLTILTLMSGVQSLYMWFSAATVCVPQVEEQGYKTEWGPARAVIAQKEVIFTSSFKYNHSSDKYYREFDPNEPQFVGVPSPAIDNSWAELLKGQYLVVSKEEAIGLSLDDPIPIKSKDGTDKYLAEVEVFHSLHCVNWIRKALAPKYYANYMHSNPKELWQLHADHCLDQIRQTIQCAAELTPVPIRPFGPTSHLNFFATPQKHTCRSWEPIREWYTKRGDSHGSVQGADLVE